MAMNNALAQLADTLQMGLDFDPKTKTIQGKAEATYAMDGYALQMQPRVVASFFEEVVGVILHVMGNLYIVAAHLDRTSVTSVYILNSAKLNKPPEQLVNRLMSLGNVVSALRPAIVSSHLYRDQKWSPFKLPTTA